jgi:hypothetical protein
MRLSPSVQTFFVFVSCGGAARRLANGCGLKQGCNALEDPMHAQVGVDGGVHGVMV